MAGYYSALDDGSYEVETDDGRKLRTAMDPSALGFEMKPQMPAQVQAYDDANRTAKLDVPTLAGSYRSVSDASPVTDSIGQPGTRLVDREPAKTIAVQKTKPSEQPSANQPTKIEAMQGLVESQLFKRSAPRKGGEVPVSRTVSQAPTPTEEDVGAIEQAEMGAEQKALDERTNLVKQRNDTLESELYRQQDNEIKLLEQQDRREKINAELMRLQQHAEQKERDAAEIKDLSPSDEFFKNSGGAWGRVLAGLVVLAGGLGAAHSAAAGQVGPNQGLESIKRGIEEQAQKLKAEHEQREAAGQTARNAYSQALAVYGTPESALEAVRLQGEAIAERKLAIMTEQYKGAEELSNLQVQMAQNQAQRAERRANLNAQRIGAVQKSYRYDPGSSGGVSMDQGALKTWIELEKTKGEGTGKTGETLVRLPDGTTGNAPTAGQAKEYQAEIMASNSVAEAAARIRHLKAQPGAKTDPGKRAQLQTAAKQLQLALKKKEALGTLDAGSVDFLNDLTGDPTGIVDFGGADSKLSEIEGSARKTIEDTKRFGLGINSQQPSGVQYNE